MPQTRRRSKYSAAATTRIFSTGKVSPDIFGKQLCAVGGESQNLSEIQAHVSHSTKSKNKGPGTVVVGGVLLHRNILQRIPVPTVVVPCVRIDWQPGWTGEQNRRLYSPIRVLVRQTPYAPVNFQA